MGPNPVRRRREWGSAHSPPAGTRTQERMWSHIWNSAARRNSSPAWWCTSGTTRPSKPSTTPFFRLPPVAARLADEIPFPVRREEQHLRRTIEPCAERNERPTGMPRLRPLVKPHILERVAPRSPSNRAEQMPSPPVPHDGRVLDGVVFPRRLTFRRTHPPACEPAESAAQRIPRCRTSRD